MPRERFDLKRYVLERKSVIDRALEHYLKQITNLAPHFIKLSTTVRRMGAKGSGRY